MPIILQVLAINLEPNSQTAIFEAVALGLRTEQLPNGGGPAFDVHVFTTSFAVVSNLDDDSQSSNGLVAGERATAGRLLAGLVPLHVVHLSGHAGPGTGEDWTAAFVAHALRETRSVADLVAAQPEQGAWAHAPPGLRGELWSLAARLREFHVATAANSMGVPETAVLLECARLASTFEGGGGPRVVLELPNLWPSVAELARSVDAIVAPSTSALSHSSVFDTRL